MSSTNVTWGNFKSQSCCDGKEMYKKSKLHVNCCFAHKTCFFCLSRWLRRRRAKAPYSCTRQWNGGHVCCRKNQVRFEAFSHELMLKPSFVPRNLQSCWPREWKRSAHVTIFEFEFTNISLTKLPWVLETVHAQFSISVKSLWWLKWKASLPLVPLALGRIRVGFESGALNRRTRKKTSGTQLVTKKVDAEKCNLFLCYRLCYQIFLCTIKAKKIDAVYYESCGFFLFRLICKCFVVISQNCKGEGDLLF